MTNNEQRLYELAAAIFLKKILPGYTNDTNKDYHESLAKNAIMTAKLFHTEYDNDLKENSLAGPFNTPPDEL